MAYKQLLFFGFALSCLAGLNEPCYGDGAQGVCVSTSDCSASDGTTIDGACPADPADVKCCSKPTCSVGSCLWQSDCGGDTVSGECPGPSDFMCCSETSADYTQDDSDLTYPEVEEGVCEAVSVAGAEAVVEAWPGRVREIQCFRPPELCDTPSDHCDGMAVDLMISDETGTATMGGDEIAEWVKDNADDLSLKYVIWGDRIWNVENDDDPDLSWSEWRLNDEENNGITGDHWDHVHVSFL